MKMLARWALIDAITRTDNRSRAVAAVLADRWLDGAFVQRVWLDRPDVVVALIEALQEKIRAGTGERR